MSKLKNLLGITSFLWYGGGENHGDIYAIEMFKQHRYFVDNEEVFTENGELAVQYTFKNFHYDEFLESIKNAGIKAIWGTQGKFSFQNTIGKAGKVAPVNEEDDLLDQNSWAVYGEMCKQIAIRYADDTADKLNLAKVWQPGDYRDNTPKAGLGLVDAIAGINEYDFKKSWSHATREVTPEAAAVSFKVMYDSIRSVSQTMKIIMPSSISPDITRMERFITKLKALYSNEGKQMPTDWYLDFHWYMRDASTDQGAGEHGITPEEANADAFALSMDVLVSREGLSGWYCTETGWATDNSKQSAPILQGFSREQSQGILMKRLALIWGASRYCEGITFWHCRDDYDLEPYAKGGVNYTNWSPKPARGICQDFIETFGELEALNFRRQNVGFSVDLSNGQTLTWSDIKQDGNITPNPITTDDVPTTIVGCMDINASNYNQYATEPCDDCCEYDNPNPNIMELYVSTNENLSGSIPLKNMIFEPNKSYYIYLKTTAISPVEFQIDGVFHRKESVAPYTLNGDSGGIARPIIFDKKVYEIKAIQNGIAVSNTFSVGGDVPEPIIGCMDENASNYDSTATVQCDGCCEYEEPPTSEEILISSVTVNTYVKDNQYRTSTINNL